MGKGFCVLPGKFLGKIKHVLLISVLSIGTSDVNMVELNDSYRSYHKTVQLFLSE